MWCGYKNNYEVELGTFKGAIDPKTETFANGMISLNKTWEPQAKESCHVLHGGIRCEKASSHLIKMVLKKFII